MIYFGHKLSFSYENKQTYLFSFNFEHFPILASLYTALYLQEVHIALE